ncbi:MAG: hypothetical protein ACI8P3_002619 [Saprospiraceae bacterium]|jgi:hypothetical protein
MKNLNFILALFAITLFSYQSIEAQSVTGKGSVVTETVDMEDISGIGLGISAKVFIQQGSKQKIEIKGQKNIIDLIKKKPNGDSWNIEFPNNSRVRNYEPIEVYVTLTKLEALSIGGSGSIIGKGKFTKVDDFDISIGGSGDIIVEVEADEISCSIGGSGEVGLSGTAEELAISIGGSGDVKAIDLSVKKCKVSSAGSGNVAITVSENLEVSLVGSGDVKYKGNPKIKTSIVGSGDVEPY